MYVYFIQGVSGGPVKIGVAQTPRHRLKCLQSGSPVELKFIGLVEGDFKLEKELHSEFNDYRLHGEWFKPSEEVLNGAARYPVPNVISIHKIKPKDTSNTYKVLTLKKEGFHNSEIARQLNISRQRVSQIVLKFT